MKRLQLLCIALCFASNLLTAQNPFWEAAVGPYGGNVNIIPTNSNVVYARHNQGFYYRSEDFGEHWAPITVQPADVDAYSEEVHIGLSGVFYSVILKQFGSTWKRQLLRSLDEGNTWILLQSDFNLFQIWETPSGALIGFDANSFTYRSTNGGLNWQNTGNIGVSLSLYSSSVTFGTNGKIMITGQNAPLVYSPNDGQHWYLGGNSGANLFSKVEMVPSGTLFLLYGQVFGGDTLMYRSTNWGLPWTPIDLDLGEDEYPNSIVELPGGRLLLTTTKHIYFSDNDGVSWNMQAPGTEEVRAFFSTGPLPNGDLIGQRKASTYRSSDGGANWTFSAFGMQLADTKQLALLDDSLQLAVTPAGVWRSENAGNTWTRLLADTSSRSVYNIHPLAVVNADSFAVSFGAQAWRTTNGGQQFQEITPPNTIHRGYLFADKSGRLFATDPFGTLLSPNFGLSWVSIFPGRSMLKFQAHPDGVLFAMTASISDDNERQIHRSGDGGLNWEAVIMPGLPPGSSLIDMTISPLGELYVNGFGSPYLKVVRSSDLGETWTEEVIPDIYANSPLAINGLNHIFTAGGQQIRILATVDQGQSWYYLPPYYESPNLIFGLELSPSGYLYIVSSNGPVYRSSQSTQNGGYLRGQVLRDADAECSTPDAQEGLKNWVVDINGEQDYVVSTSVSGQYAVFADAGAYELHARVPQSLWWSICDSLLTVQLDSAQTVDSLDFVGVASSECPLMTVDIEIPRLRRCFDNPVYVAYCNAGSEPADSAWVDIYLDPYLSLVGSAQPFEFLGDNTYRFHVGDVDWGDCGQFSFTVYVDCDSTVLGQTHCISAHSFPDTLCTAVPEWSGANIEAQANCQDSLVQLRLQNTGTNPSGTLNYIIIEDDVVLFQGQEQYEIGESITLDYAANGSTWRIESQQEPGHPFSNLALAFLEGCGGYESLGFINQFSINGWAPSTERSCVENTGSYDPNDKQGFPLGYGSDNRIRPGQALEYLVRFQNTGTDTAFTVQIRDTLSAWLDPATLRPGASSHPYTWSLSGPGVLAFRFDNILLPDSNVNLIGSQGFVSFKIDQRPDVPLETQILNSAAIYFDFNEPVITNQTLHTVGIDYITSVQDVGTSAPSIGIQPNPALNETLLHLPEGTERLMLTDVLGRPQGIFRVQGPVFRLERGNLPAGVYWLRAEDRKGNVTGVGKVVWR